MLKKLKKIFTAKEIEEGERIPKYYGIVYSDFERYVTVCYVIPFHILVSLYIKIRGFLKCSLYTKDALGAIFEDGRRRGYDEGFERGYFHPLDRHCKGYDYGYEKGYKIGYKDGLDSDFVYNTLFKLIEKGEEYLNEKSE